MSDTAESVKQAVKLVCDRCGTTENVRRTPHSLAEAGMRGNPPLCGDCNAEVSR